MLDSASKTFFHLIAQSRTLKTLASRYGMRQPSSFARRFIAGETVAEAIEAARVVEARGMAVTLDLLGESVTNLATADAATRDYIAVIDAMIASGVGRNISLKLTQLGLDVDRASAIDHLRKILELAEPAGFFVRIDMESSRYTAVTLDIFETLWGLFTRETSPRQLMGPLAGPARRNLDGRVFMGAFTFIGNAPNLIVYAIARERVSKCQDILVIFSMFRLSLYRYSYCSPCYPLLRP
jgi:hypothetical protein